MEAYQQRVLDEQAELKVKLNALRAFVPTSAFTKLHDIDKELLVKQCMAMAEYSRILQCRISRFP
jgi:hypothetical protein